MEIVKPDYIKFIYAKAKKLVFLTPLLCVVIILFPAFFILNYFSLFTEYDFQNYFKIHIFLENCINEYYTFVSRAKEREARFTWIVASIAVVIAMVGCSLYCISVLSSCIRNTSFYLIYKKRSYLVIIITILGFLCIIYLLRHNLSYPNKVSAHVFGVLYCIKISDMTANDIFRNTNLYMHSLVVIYCLAFNFSCVFICCKPSNFDRLSIAERASDTARRIYYLRNVVFSGAIALAVGVLGLRASVAWPLALLSDVTDKVGTGALQAATNLTTGLVIFWGAIFSFVLLLSYLPAIWVLWSRADHISRNISEDDTNQSNGIDSKISWKIRQEWLRNHGLEMQWQGQVTQIASTIAPLMAASFDTLFSNLIPL